MLSLQFKQLFPTGFIFIVLATLLGVRQLKSSIHRNIINVNIMTEHSKKLLSCRSASYVIAKGKTNGIREQGRVELSMFFYTDFIDKQNFRPSEG